MMSLLSNTGEDMLGKEETLLVNIYLECQVISTSLPENFSMD